jgi:hypothetical protein
MREHRGYLRRSWGSCVAAKPPATSGGIRGTALSWIREPVWGTSPQLPDQLFLGSAVRYLRAYGDEERCGSFSVVGPNTRRRLKTKCRAGQARGGLRYRRGRPARTLSTGREFVRHHRLCRCTVCRWWSTHEPAGRHLALIKPRHLPLRFTGIPISESGCHLNERINDWPPASTRTPSTKTGLPGRKTTAPSWPLVSKPSRHGDTLMVCRDGSDERVADGLDERMAHLKAVATDV